MSPGVGVTAWSKDDAVELFRQAFPADAVVNVKAIEDMGDLDQNHVVPNAGNWLRRGIWFPLGHGPIS